ncbi:multisubunit sodium/proton antiporter, MrpD subunit [Kushneria avicenniae]|uniref:Multisubunit sodium/proton antiporter, MrpD subunit n=1 Tax=Kushneria avicenniae TaxID=402385 RepID=A0A1I1KI58_9GAMM|nr:proton-conducting transporter membrane subunit [Kushneria avicenniae]SFC59972.1 multisubunit sodium/proton antiporter, MrpD subunit [Kushneria avicenniae]
MSPEVALPILIPLTAGALSMAFWRSRLMQRLIGIAGTAALLGVGIWLFVSVQSQGYVIMNAGGWAAPFGITLVADLLSAIMVVLTGIIGFAVALFSLPTIGRGHETFGYYPLLHLLLAGVAGAFLTGDIFNLYVWFEVMLLASFALLILGGERAQMEGAIKYVTLNLLSSVIFLSAIGLLYGLLGTLNMADIARRIALVEDNTLIDVIAVMFMISFGIKAAAFPLFFWLPAAFPLFFWLPAAYHTPPVAVSALFAGLLTKVGVYALFRVFTLMFNQSVDFTHEILLWGAGLTMITGVLGAAAQFEFRRILSFHIVSQIGYMMMGLALFTPLALVGGVFYILHHIIVKTNLFLISGVVYRLKGTHDLKRLGGVYKAWPLLGVLFLIPALSLAGVPPLSGFFAKFVLIRASIEAGHFTITVVALLVGLLTLYSMTKIWAEVFWKKAPEEEDASKAMAPVATRHLWLMLLPVVGLAACTVFIGLNGQLLYDVAEASAAQLLDPQAYIDAVLGEQP